MNRDLIISVLLIIAGIVLAIALFGAGAVWKGRNNRHNSGLSQDTRFNIAVNLFVKTYQQEQLNWSAPLHSNISTVCGRVTGNSETRSDVRRWDKKFIAEHIARISG